MSSVNQYIMILVSACIVSVRRGLWCNWTECAIFNRLNYDPILFVCLFTILFVCFIVSGSHLRFVSCLLFVSVVVCWLVRVDRYSKPTPKKVVRFKTNASFVCLFVCVCMNSCGNEKQEICSTTGE